MPTLLSIGLTQRPTPHSTGPVLLIGGRAIPKYNGRRSWNAALFCHGVPKGRERHRTSASIRS